MEKHYLLGEVAKLVGRRPHQIVYLLTSGQIPEAEQRIGNRRLFSEEDVIRLARHFKVTPKWDVIESAPANADAETPERLDAPTTLRGGINGSDRSRDQGRGWRGLRLGCRSSRRSLAGSWRDRSVGKPRHGARDRVEQHDSSRRCCRRAHALAGAFYGTPSSRGGALASGPL